LIQRGLFGFFAALLRSKCTYCCTSLTVARHRIAQELHDSVGQLLSAIKYTVEDGIMLLSGGDADALRLTIADNGLGFSLEEVARTTDL
jgi:signal transduction histidine kinase